MIRRIRSDAVLICAAALLAAPQALAQSFPGKPITIVVPFAAGGPTDIVARVIADRFTATLGQRVIVENAPGAAGTTGAARAARAPADGYTLLMGPMSTMAFSPTFYPNAAVHTLKDFEPVGIVASAPIVLVARKDIAGDTLKAFVETIRKNPKLTNGNAGVGSTSHLACVLLNSRFGVSPTIGPYKGTAPVLQDMLTGQIDYLCDQSTSVMGQVTAGAVKALAVLAPSPSPALPDVPTIAQAGYPGAEMVVWNALFAPKGTPREVISQLNDAIGKAIGDPAALERFRKLGAEPPAASDRSPEALGRIHAADVEKWGKVIRDANIQLP
ncbi:MAG: tripartite tricarboxylate transporter substrate binding protein BugD [Hyphomicrobiales bacterium]|nr:tripartite tricarboxylate transporter substrate binding protein BugD [Hyphomicrobiales bacterium]